jgi:hypothetical protein
LTYGLGTCAWAVSSQNIWQQTVNQLLLAAGAYFIVAGKTKRAAALAGLALGAAAPAQPTSLVAVLAVLAYLRLYHKKSVVRSCSARPHSVRHLCYNHYYFGPVHLCSGAHRATSLVKDRIPRRMADTVLHGGNRASGEPFARTSDFFADPCCVFLGDRAFASFARLASSPAVSGSAPHDGRSVEWFDWWGGPPTATAMARRGPISCSASCPSPNRSPRPSTYRCRRSARVVGRRGGRAMSYDRYWNLRRVFVIRVPTSLEAMDFVTEDRRRRDSSERNLRGAELLRHRLPSAGTACGPSDNLIVYQLSSSRVAKRRLPFGFDDLGR